MVVLQNVLLLFLLPLVYALATNRTIDDTAGDLITGVKPIYVPSAWQGPDCGGCKIKPPLDEVFMETYSALTYWPENFPVMSIEFSFQGTAIYVYFILANYVGDGVTTETMCNFTLDGQYVSTFHHIPTTSTGYVFNALVFSRDGLSNTNHTLLISTSGINQHLFTNFDYANYTFDSSITSAIPSPTPSVTSQRSPLPISTQSTGSNTFTPVITVVGGVIAGIVVVLFALLAFLCFRQRKRAKFHSTRVRVSANESFYAGLSPLQALRPGTVISRWSESYTNVNPLDYSEAPPLPPPYIYDTSSESTCSDTVQSRRQAEINETIRSLTLEMERLAGVERSLKEQSTSLPSSFSLHRSLGETGSLTSLQEQMNATRGQIKYLKTQLRSSDWAQGSLDDRPPPTYSTIIIPRE